MQKSWSIVTFSFLLLTTILESVYGAQPEKPNCPLITASEKTLSPKNTRWTAQVPFETAKLTHCDRAACWLDTGLELFTVYLKNDRLIGPTDRLSREYYFLKALEKNIRSANPKTSFETIIDVTKTSGDAIFALKSLIQNHQIVTEQNFEAAFKIATTNRGSKSHSIFEELDHALKIPTAKNLTPKQRAMVLYDQFFSEFDNVQKTKSPDNLFTWTTTRLKSDQINPLSEVDHDLITSIDRGIPVIVTLEANESTYDLFRQGGFTLERIQALRAARETKKVDSFAVMVIGYALGEDKKISTYLLKSTKDFAFGEDGKFAVPRSYMVKFLRSATGLDARFMH